MGAVEKRIFTQGIDSDTTPELTGEGRYLSAKNMNVIVSDGNNYGTAEVALGNTPYTITLPAGDNKCVGTYEDKTSNHLYYFNYNSLDQHGIYRIESGVSSVTAVLVDPLLNFNRSYLITGIDIAYIDVDQPILGWTDGGAPNAEPTIIYNPPRQIDVNKAIAYTNGDFINGYPAITIEVLDQIKWQGKFAPQVAIANDDTYNRNNLTGRLFQFAYAYEYFDYSVSALSDYSEVVTPIGDEIIGNVANTPPYLNNRIDVTITRGADICTKIRIYTRIQNSTNQDWYLVDTIPNPTTPTVTYQFFNDNILEPLDVNEAKKPYDSVPRAAKCETIVAGNRKVWANAITEFDQPVPDISLLNQSIDLPQIDNALVVAQFGLVVGEFTVDLGNIGSEQVIVFNIPNDPALIVQGNLIRFTYLSAPAPTLPDYIFYYITAEDVADFNVLIANLILFLQNAGIMGVTNTGTFSPLSGGSQLLLPNQIASNIGTSTADYPQLSQNVSSTINSAILSSMDKVPTFKSGTTHYFALEYADRAGRFDTVVLDSQFNVYVPFCSETLSTTPYLKQNQIISAIRHIPPIWATHYRWKYGFCGIQSFVQTAIKNKTVSGAQNTLYLDPLVDYSTEYPNSVLSYSYTSGDRCRIITDVSDTVAASYIDVPVTGYDEGSLALTVNTINYPNVTISAGTLIEIYTPRATFTSDQIFYYTLCSEEYEVGNAGLPNRFHKGEQQDQDPTNPTGVPAVSTFVRGNAWIRPRQMNCYTPTPTDEHKYWVEDYNFSDFYDSKVYDKGRANKYDPNYREVNRPTTSFYSQPFIPETNINGLGSVFPENFASDDIRVLLAYGSIQRLYAEGVQLYVFQEIKTGVVRVNERVAFDAGNNNIVGATDQVLNPINYFAGDYGIGQHPESFAWYGYAKYHVDVRRGVVLRLSADGYTPISSIYKVNNFTTDKFAEIFSAGQKVNIYGAYNTRFNRYEYSVEETELKDRRVIQGYTYAFTEQSNTWTSFYDYLPDFMGTLAQELITFKDGIPYLHNSGTNYANYYGAQYHGELQVVFNQQPSESKLYNTVAIEGTDAWDIPLITVFDGSAYQESSLLSTDFDLYEGKYRAWFLMDALTPNVVNPLIDGDYLRGRYVILNLLSPLNKYARIFALDVNTIPSAISRL
jgi:hypothetical protein